MTVNNTETIRRRQLILVAASACMAPALVHGTTRAAEIEALLDGTYGQLVQVHGIPGLVVGLIFEGKSYFLESGTTMLHGGGAATRDTIFELGSVSKCFTSTLAAFAHVQGRLSLDQPVGDIVPRLRSTPIGKATPLHLATYTAGGLPLQFPEDVTSNDMAIEYLSAFTPGAAPGLVRQYSNPSVGLLGHATAQSMAGDFVELSKRALIDPLGLRSTYLRVPDAQMHRYAWGHDKHRRQVRVNPGAFDAQAYGVKSTASDMLRWLGMLLETDRMPPPLRLAVAHTMNPRYHAGPMQQGMGWEMYPSPWSLQALLEGNSARTVLDALPVQAALSSPDAMRSMLLNKTGSTSGFAAYVALVPHRQAALVMLANQNFPTGDRVTAAHQVLNTLGVLG